VATERSAVNGSSSGRRPPLRRIRRMARPRFGLRGGGEGRGGHEANFCASLLLVLERKKIEGLRIGRAEKQTIERELFGFLARAYFPSYVIAGSCVHSKTLVFPWGDEQRQRYQNCAVMKLCMNVERILKVASYS
jgi:hypothetical protein